MVRKSKTREKLLSGLLIRGWLPGSDRDVVLQRWTLERKATINSSSLLNSVPWAARLKAPSFNGD